MVVSGPPPVYRVALPGGETDGHQMRLAGSCAGWPRRPKSGEFYDAVRAEVLDDRQRAILYVFAQEAEWHELIAVEAEGTLGGVPADEGIPPRQLGNRGAHAIINALYTRCCIRTRDGAIEVTTATGAQGEKTRRIEAASAERQFEAAGADADGVRAWRTAKAAMNAATGEPSR